MEVGAETGATLSLASRVWRVTAAEHAPAATIWAALVNTTWSGVLAITVSSCEGLGESPAAAAVRVTLPSAMARNEKVVADAPDGMETAEAAVPAQPAPAKNETPAAGEAESATPVSDETGDTFPWASRAWSATGAEQPPAATVWAALVKARWSGAAGATFTGCDGLGDMPGASAARVKLPLAVARNENVAVLPPEPMDTEETAAPEQPAPAKNVTPADGEAESATEVAAPSGD